MGNNMDVDGILVNDTDMKGNSCQVIGDLECDDGEMPACSGLGVIDCTDDCPGTEEEFKHFREVMEDKDFGKKFPKIAALSKKPKPEPEPMTSDDDGTEPEPEPTKPSRDIKAEFLASLTKCKDFSEDTKALLSLVKGDGMQFGATSNDPNDLTYVAPGAISNISQIEYDYSEYYDEVESETTKKRRDVEDTKESKEENVLVKKIDQMKKELKLEDPDTNADKVEKPLKDKTLTMNKKDYYEKLNGLDNDDLKNISEEDKINMNMIRSVDDELEMTNITITVGDNITEVVVEENVTESDPEVVEELSKRVKREVDEMRNLFYSAVKLVRDGAEEAGPGRHDLVYRLAHRMAALRRKREVEVMDKSTETIGGFCNIKNMTCSEFPTKSKCRGIGIGRCGSNADLLKQLFTPHVVMVSSVSIIVIVMVTVGLSYYCYKLKTENRIEPSEDEEHDVANGGVKTLETNQG